MARRGNKRDYSLDPEDYICSNCKAPPSCDTWTCPRDWLKRLEKLEAQADGLTGYVSTVFLAALVGADAQTVRQRAARGEYGPARRVGEHLCVPWDGALTREVNGGKITDAG